MSRSNIHSFGIEMSRTLRCRLAASHLEHALAEPFESEPLGPPVKELAVEGVSFIRICFDTEFSKRLLLSLSTLVLSILCSWFPWVTFFFDATQ